MYLLVPTGPPLNVSGQNLTETAIELSWKEIELDHQNGDIFNYKIKYKNIRTNFLDEKDVGNVLTANITGIKVVYN